MSYIFFKENLLTNVSNLTFTGVPNLKELYLNKNQISVIEVQAFRGLGKLDVLHISNNNLSVITFDILSKLKRLRYLYMANNHLKHLHNGTFSDLENMRYLDLNFNKITTVASDAFKGVVSLHVLKLAQNNIQSIGLNALLPTHHLDLLNISGNSITTLNNFSHIFQILDKFYMEDNPIMCNADLKPVFSWYQKNNSSDVSDDPVCDKPECLKGQKLKALDLALDLKSCSIGVRRGNGEGGFKTTLPSGEFKPPLTTGKPDPEPEYVVPAVLGTLGGIGLLMLIAGAYYRFRNGAQQPPATNPAGSIPLGPVRA